MDGGREDRVGYKIMSHRFLFVCLFVFLCHPLFLLWKINYCGVPSFKHPAGAM